MPKLSVYDYEDEKRVNPDGTLVIDECTIYSFRDDDRSFISRLEVHQYPGIENFDWCLLSSLYVDEKYRHQGYATRMIERAMKDAAERGQGVYLLVIADNEEALHLYQKLGFIKLRDHYFDGRPTQYYIMTHGNAPTSQLVNMEFGD